MENDMKEIIETAIESFTESFSKFYSKEDKIWLLVFVLFFVVSCIWGLSYVKGKLGERAVKKKLKKLSPDIYKICNDIMIKNEKGNTSQIDHTVVSKYGIFVIETKNYQGWIIGDEKSRNWTQVINKKKSSFLNPIRQNYGHIKALMGLLDLPKEKFIPIIAFSARADLKINTTTPVIYYSEIDKAILQHKDEILTEEQVKEIYNTLIENNIVDAKQRKEHVKYIRKNVQTTHQLEEMGICPKCGGTLILHDGKYGKFYGCSNYPKCRYVKKRKD